MSVSAVVSRYRRPEYTGENRCTPCTVVNVCLAAALALALSAFTPLVGAAAFLASLATIYLRGYLVPGTPELTERYLPASVLALFGKEAVEPTVRADATDREAGAALLRDAGVLTGEGAATDLGDEFRTAWRDRLAEWEGGDPGADDVARLFDADDVDRKGDLSFVVDGNAMVRWASRGALIADVAAAAELRARIGGWDTLDRPAKQDVLTALRLFVDECPACGGRVETRELTDDPCCQPEYTAYDAVCGNCGADVASVTVLGTPESGTHPAVRYLDD